MKTSKKGLGLIKRHEGLRLSAYLCPGGEWTIGYGHTGDVAPGDKITEEQADQMISADLRIFEDVINKHLEVQLSQNQFDAIVVFSYNVGCGALLGSTLWRKLQADPSDESIADEFAKWRNARGKVLPGLVKRRADEAKLYFNR